MPSSEQYRQAQEVFDAIFSPEERSRIEALVDDPRVSFDDKVDAVMKFFDALDESEAVLWPGGEGQALLRARIRGEITEAENDALRARLYRGDAEVGQDLKRLLFLKAAKARR
jgi:hypothetical protein